jgi:polar amino acid transport system substrate-binding protein
LDGILHRLLAILALLFAVPAVHADTLDEVRRRGVIRWGADEEGGGPYIYKDEHQKLTGFEVELMDELARRLKVTHERVQGEWRDLPKTLDNRDDLVDILLNGFELTPEHLANKRIASVPYYAYELQLIARTGDAVVIGWDDLRNEKKKVKVGVLSGSAAHTFAQKNFDATADVIAYESTTTMLRQIKNLALDATIQDNPATTFYLPDFPGLQVVGPNVARGYYVIYCRAADTRLRDAVDAALLALARDGTLQQIYSKYGIWNETQEWVRGLNPATQFDAGAGPPERPQGWAAVAGSLPLLFRSAGMTVLLSVCSMPLAMLVGLSIAVGRLYGPAFLKPVLTFYIELIRGTPLLLQLSVLFFLLPEFGVKLPAFVAAVVGLAVNYSAYEAEIYRAGLQAIPAGQMEAALALGMTRRQALWHVVIPQAVRLVIPPVTNDFIALFKDTAVCSVITVVELTKAYQLTYNTPGAYIQIAIITAFLYLAMSYPLAILTRRLERQRMAKPQAA